MDLRRVGSLPPYVFAAINDLKLELRRAGEDVVDLGFGNPDLPTPELTVEKLREAVLNPRNHRYSTTSPTRTSPSTATCRPRSFRPRARPRSRSSCTR